MPSTTDEQDEHGLFLLLKGASGGGKSTAAFSFPGLYVFDFDRKMPGVALKHFKGKKIDWNIFNTIFEVVKKLDEFKTFCPYETLYADSFTYLCQLIITSIDGVKGTNAAELLNKVTKGKGGSAGMVEAMGMDYWSAESRFAEFFIDRLKGLWAQPGNPKHVIVSAHVVTVEGKPDPFNENKILTTRGIVSKGNKVGAWLPTGFDDEWVVGQHIEFGTSNVKRVVVTEATGLDSAKCSLNLPSIIDFTGNSLESPNFYREICKSTGWK